jgi:ferritin-like metal-binding protein YciE
MEQTFDGLILHFLQDVYYAERQVLKALPKMAKAAHNEQLRKAFMDHHAETQEQVERLQQVFESLGKRARGITCEAINGLIEECEELLGELKEPGPVRDAGLVACAQAVEHYEMARYGALIAWMKTGGHTQGAELLAKTLEEEKKADTLLNQLASRVVNKEAAKAA